MAKISVYSHLKLTVNALPEEEIEVERGGGPSKNLTGTLCTGIPVASDRWPQSISAWSWSWSWWGLEP